MTDLELALLLPQAKAFFAIDDYPGVLASDNQAWIFEGGTTNPRPITRREIEVRGGTQVPIDEAAELFSVHPEWLDFLKKKTNEPSSTGPIRLETLREDLRMKVRVLTNRDTFIPAKE